MSRRYADRVPVVLASAGATGPDAAERAPQSFRWRREWYRVSAVLARWVEASAWWRDAVPGSKSRGDHPRDSSFERVVWRVEARTRSGAAGVFDLGHVLRPSGAPSGDETEPDRWFLVRAMD